MTVPTNSKVREALKGIVHFDCRNKSEKKTFNGACAHDRLLQREEPGEDFSWSKQSELHAARRRAILEAHPEIKALFRPDPLAGVFAVVTVLLQFISCYFCKDLPWAQLLICTYLISGTLNHSLQLAIHELSHDLFFYSKAANQAMAYFANLPIGVPMASTFRAYHLEHHSGQGIDGLDVDIPTETEAKMFTSVPGRLLFVILQPFFYSLRPLFIRPKPMGSPEIMNWAVQVLLLVMVPFNLLVLQFWGHKALFYFIAGALLGTGLHPLSGHFVGEHFEFVEDQETYSYYGPLNYLVYNVGFHNEHHDFPRVPGRLLPEVKRLAPEWYDMPSYRSWVKVIFDFIFADNVNLFCRVKRNL